MNKSEQESPVTELLNIYGKTIHEFTKISQNQNIINDLIIKKQKQDINLIKEVIKPFIIVQFIIVGLIIGYVINLVFQYVLSLYNQVKPNDKLSFITGAGVLLFSVFTFFVGRWSKRNKE